MQCPRPVVLIVLDGFGVRAESADNAVRLARTPTLTTLQREFPNGLLSASGLDVGLPAGQMGSSEVGHLNLGAGRVAVMDMTRIDAAVADGTLEKQPALVSVLEQVRSAKGRLHVLGLVSDGGVHSSIAHLQALIDIAHRFEVPVLLHAFLDGREVLAGTAPAYIESVERSLVRGGGRVATVSGRYWAMDRDRRWARIERAFRAIVEAAGHKASSPIAGIDASYAAGISDEFVEPFVVAGYDGVRPNDAALHFNYRPDRARQLTQALAVSRFDAFERPERKPPFLGRYVSMTNYAEGFGLPTVFGTQSCANTLGEVIAAAGLKQFRCAETEKYGHVTYFFNGGREAPFEGETRELIPSRTDVATYDQRPEMNADAVAHAVAKAIASGEYDFILANFANTDAVGHTGQLHAAIQAVEAVDAALTMIVDAARVRGGAVVITADHGNCEQMRDLATGKPHTAHTLNPVPIIYVNDRDRGVRFRDGGRLSDVAPTLLAVLDLPQPSEMTGTTLLLR